MGKQIWKPGNMLYPLPAVLVSVGDRDGNRNIFTVAWTGTVCTNPPMAYISVRPERYSYHMIEESGEFVIKPSSHASKTYSTASTYLTATRGSIYTAAGYYATSGLSAAGIAGLGCVATTPFSIASHISNPYLLDGQKACPVGEELIAAAGSIALAWAIFNFWNPSGWVAIAVTVGSATLSIGTSHIISAQSRAWENENKQKWGVIQ